MLEAVIVTRGNGSYFRKIDNESIHVEAIQKAGKTFAESAETFVHELQVHEVGFEICHGVAQLSKLVV